MKRILAPPSPVQTQSRLLRLAGVFLFLYSLILTLAPAARARTWAVDYRWSHWLGFVAWVVIFTLAHILSRRRLPDADPYIIPIAALLTGWGILTIYRLVPSFGLRQTAWLLVCGLVFLLGLRLSPELRFLRRYKYLWLTSGLLLTALTLLFGTNPSGGGLRLWLGCCGVYLQPSEPLKLLVIIYLAAYLADRLPLSLR
ncbi:MAG: FtsW/RodA/SpoVE family cell cycle protein, partial [Chloroflexi bacterium]|nr:FtsW/RodA/SpoVE family cell cycle protein [Chloroflexota bacterium]